MLQVSEVSLTLDGLLILDKISLELHKNECVVIVGPSGSGKSTLLSVISGLLKPDQGKILLDGCDVTGDTGIASYMQQKHLLLPWRTLIDNCALPLTLRGIPQEQARQKVREYLAVFGLEGFENYYPAALSGGMCQRAALLRTFLSDRPIMLLDEPFASLDALTRRRMQEWLTDIQERYQLSFLFVTHDLEEAVRLGDRIYVVSSLPGRVVQTLTVPEDYQGREQIKTIMWNLLGSQ